MARPASRHPTELELLILKIIWDIGPCPVRTVREALAPKRKLAYTSVMTIMNIMVAKKYLSRKKVGPSYTYQPRVTKTATVRGMLKDLVTRVFDGSAAAVVLNLLETTSLDEQELVRIRAMLDQNAP